MKSSATAEAREALIAEFVSQWSFANEAEDAEFGRSLRGLLDALGLSSLPSQNASTTRDDLQVGDDEDGARPPRVRRIILFDASP